MNDSAPRFATPMDAPRPRGARLLEAFSPKLGRRVRVFDRAIRRTRSPTPVIQLDDAGQPTFAGGGLGHDQKSANASKLVGQSEAC